MIFARKWRQWRDSEGWTAKRLSIAIQGRWTGYWSDIESGKCPPPSNDMIRRACEVMGSPERAAYWQTIARWDRAERSLVNPTHQTRRLLAEIAEWDATGYVPTADDVKKAWEG